MDIDTLRARIDEARAAQYAAASPRQRLMDSLCEEDRQLVSAHLLGACSDEVWHRAVAYTLAHRGKLSETL